MALYNQTRGTEPGQEQYAPIGVWERLIQPQTTAPAGKCQPRIMSTSELARISTLVGLWICSNSHYNHSNFALDNREATEYEPVSTR